MGKVADEAVSIFLQGYNCAQSVLLACGRRYGLDDRTAMRMASAFGGGMTVGLTCGVVTGALMAIGLKHAKTDLGDERPQANVLIRRFLDRFAARHGSLVCKDLLGADFSDPVQAKAAREKHLSRSVCPPYVRTAAEILEELLPELSTQGEKASPNS